MSIQGNWDRRVSRRAFLGAGGLGAVAMALDPGSVLAQPWGRGGSAGFGPLVEDPGGLLDLPRGFQYRVISQEGTDLSSGKPVPGDHDGMAAFRGPGNTTVLVRNHELSQGENPPVIGENPYDPDEVGGTTGILVGPDRKVIKDYVTSSGTNRNCSGGPTPWGTWLTCEETRDLTGKPHGYVFEVLPGDEQSGLSDEPIRDMGFFSHEAVGIDPQTGIAYLTEDDFRGNIPDNVADEDLKPTEQGGTRASFLYRFIPNAKNLGPGAYLKGGTLQAMKIEGRPGNYNMDLAEQGQAFQVSWVTVDPATAHEDALAHGAAAFNRLEGADWAAGAFWFDDTAGGEERLGQVYRYIPATNTLELFFEASDANNMEAPDNLVIAPFGDVWFCEDGDGADRVMGITPDKQVYEFARNRLNDSELCGCTFSPEGRTFFVNIQSPGITFAIWGPFARVNRRRQREMAAAAPPAAFAPRVSDELAEAADLYGLNPLEAAAFDRLGAKLLA